MKARTYLFLSLFFGFVLNLSSFAQSAGDFRSAASGDWSSSASWQTFDGTNWVAATGYPSAANGYIIIRGGHVLTLPSSFSLTADQIIVQENSQIQIAANATLDLVDGPGVDLDIAQAVSGTVPGIVQVAGTLKANNDVSLASQANSLIIQDGGTYQHHYTIGSGNIPFASWGIGSTLLISGYTSNHLAPGNLDQAFHHVVWNTPDLSNTQGYINLGGLLKTVDGNLIINSTGTNTLSFTSGSSTDILAVARNFRIGNGSNVLINSTVQVRDTLALINSSLENTTGLTLADGATFLLEGTPAFSGSPPLSLGMYSLYYKDIPTTVSPGLEFPNIETGLANLKIENSTMGLTGQTSVNGDLILEPAGTFMLNGNDLLIKGNFINNGVFEAGINKVFFNGSVTQSIEGTITTTFHDLEISNTANLGLVANSFVNIKNSLVLGEGATFDPDGGDLATDGGNDVTFLSVAYNQAAFIAPLPSTAQIAGNIVLQHYIPPVKMFRYITTATKDVTLSQWTDDFKVTGNFEGGDGGWNSIYVFDEPSLDWVAFPGSTGSLSSPIEIGKGHAAYMYNGTTPTIIDTRGQINSGSFSIPLSFTESTEITKGSNLVGNPYPSTIDWNSPNWQRQDINPTASIYNKLGGRDVFSTLNAATGIALNAENTFINSGQAFFVTALGETASLIANENIKVTPSTATQPNSISDAIVVTCSNGSVKDQLAFAFREGATLGYDSQFDSPKTKNSSINLSYYELNGRELAQSVIPWFDCSLELPIAVDQAPVGTYQLSFNHLESLSKEVNILLQDNFLNTSTSVLAGTTYSFDITSDPLTFGKDRFKLLLTLPTIPEITSITYETSCTGIFPVTVNGTTSGINYQLFKGTTAVTDPIAATSDVTNFSISASNLTEGANTITIQAFHSGCDPVSMATELQLEYSGNYTINSTEGATSCSKDPVTLTATASSDNASYNWYESLEATTAVHEATTGSFTTPVLEQTTTYYVAALNAYGCESERVAVEAVILQTPEITSITYEESCTGTVPVTVNGTVDGLNYQLFKGITAVTDPVAASSEVTSFSISATDLSEGANTITVQVYHTGCDPVTMATELQLDYSGNYSISSTEGATSCTTGSVTLTATASSTSASYKWYESLTATTAVYEATTGSFTTPVLEQSRTYYVAAVNAYGCESDKVAVEATIVIPQVTTISYEESCTGEIPVTVNGTVENINYQLFNGTAAVSDIVISTSETITFTIQASDLAEGINTLTVIATTTGCEVSMNNSLQLDYSGNYTISSTEGATSCTTGSVTLTATASSTSASYKWYESLTATTAVYEATTGSFATPALEQSRTYYVAAVNAYGCESDKVAVEATILQIPEISSVTYETSCTGTIPVSVNGTVSGLNYQLFKGTTALTTSISASSNVTSFSVNAADLSEGSNTITVQAFHSGCDPVTMATELQLDYSGNYTISSTEGATSCTTGSVTLTATASSTSASYKWYESLTATTAVYEATTGSFATPALEQSRTYYVAALNAYGCESDKVAVEAVIKTFDKPEIKLVNEVLHSSYPTGNQWLLNGSPIPNATEASITLTESGTYGLEVITQGCKVYADEIEFSITGLDKEELEENFSLYPNPTQSSFTVNSSLLKESPNLTYRIFQHNGTIVQQGTITKIKSDINIINLNAGLYLVEISAGHKIQYGKLVKR